MTQTRDQLFISYSREDKQWVEKLHAMLRPLVRQDKLKIWDDSQIFPGTYWYVEIQKAIASARAAVLFVSADFLASDFIADHEIPMLRAAEKEGLLILWIAVNFSMYRETDLANYQALNDPATPLESLSPTRQNEELRRICSAIKKVLERTTPHTH